MMKIKLIITGAAGRMGKRILALTLDSGRFDIIAAIDRKDHPQKGEDAGTIAGTAPINVKLTDTYPPEAADVVVDFSQPEGIEQTLDYCLKTKTSLVFGVTGLSEEQQDKLKSASKTIPIVYATNMSVGMNMLFRIVGKVASILGEEYDIEIVEQHHNQKKDSPSGTALTLAENICKATGRNFPESVIHGRHGKNALRQKGTIGMHAVRAGDITGVHSIIFGTQGETVVLNHTATSRDTFTRGALRAAQWIIEKEPALYNMADVLGIKE